MSEEQAVDGTQPTYAEARARFPLLETVAYLNAGTFGPLSSATAEAVRAELERDLVSGRSGKPQFLRTLELREAARSALAALVAAEPAQIALTASTTDGCNIVLAGLDLNADDEIVTTTDEHFGLLGPLGASRARVIVAAPDPAAIQAAVTPRTRLLALSQVLWTTGAVLPARELRSSIGVPVLVDGAQSVGAIPVDAAGLDFLTISGQKWLCGPDSTGALVVADPERLRVAAPSSLSQVRHDPDGSFEPRAGAARFEPDWWPSSSLMGLMTAIAERPGWCFDRAAEMADRCRTMLSTRVDVVVPDVLSTIVAFRPPGDAAELVAELHAVGVRVREIPGRDLVRVSCGWWTSDEDIDRLAAALPA
jgi:L-cysteine/cystine lyase